jgi:hypothetical protein
MADESKAVEETAKAVQEVAKASGKAIDATRDAGSWVGRILGRPLDELSKQWTDRITTRRIESAIYDWERLESLMHKTIQRLQKRGVKIRRSLAPKVLLPLLEHATMEQEEDLHGLYANLLATGVDADRDEIHRKYVSTLAELTRRDAEVLADLYEKWQKIPTKWERRPSALVEYSPGIDTAPEDEVSNITLNRLGLIAPNLTRFSAYQPDPDPTWEGPRHRSEEVILSGDLTVVVLTKFGEEFCVAAIDPA